jgi:energy-coupling factor transporter ATP-binding protein EcfA2
LSAGEKRRVALAGVLVMSPKLLILDEPTSWLDPPGQRGLIELLRQLPQPKLIATHDAAFALALTDRALFLKAGRILADGPVAAVIDQFDWRC